MNTPLVFRVEIVEPAKPPRGITQGEWCRYVLSNEQSQIVGKYRGSLQQTRHNAETLANHLNDRARTGKAPGIARAHARRKAAKKPTATKAH